MKNALLIIDVQKFFINKFTKDIPKKIANFLKNNSFDFTIFSKFVFSKKSSFARFVKKPRLVSPKDTDIVPELRKFITKDNVFTKSTFSVFKSKKFLKSLKKKKVKNLYICGFDTNGCIFSTAIEAFDLGFDVKILENLCASHSSKRFHKNAIEILRKNVKGLVISSKEVIL